MPDLRSLSRTLIRGHPEGLESTGFRLQFIPMKIGAGMTTFMKTVVYGQTLIKKNKRGINFLLFKDKNKKEKIYHFLHKFYYFFPKYFPFFCYFLKLYFT